MRVRIIPWVLGLLVLFGCSVGAYYWAKAAGWLTPADRVSKLWDTSNPAQAPAAAPVKATPPPPAPKYRSMMFVANKVDLADTPEPDTFQLAPGATKLPCIVETASNSDVGDSFWTAKVRNDVYDTATGARLLVPQGSTLLGKASGSALLYGNERIPTVSLTLSVPDGRHVDLGQAPATDQQGMAGLTGKVDQHY